MTERTTKLYCIGDSHASFFSGTDRIQPCWPEAAECRLPLIEAFRLGAVLAYNLPEANTSSRGRENLFDVLRSRVPAGSRVMLCFGEIDCRAHLIRQSIRQGRSLPAVVEECVERYYGVVREVAEAGYEVGIWNAVPSTRHDTISNPDFPVHGSCQERNQATWLFNLALRSRCLRDGRFFISIFDELLDEAGLTNMDYYMDAVHLSQRAMPLAIGRIRAALGDSGFRVPMSHRIGSVRSSLRRIRSLALRLPHPYSGKAIC